jgi:hypothetical protein
MKTTRQLGAKNERLSQLNNSEGKPENGSTNEKYFSYRR